MNDDGILCYESGNTTTVEIPRNWVPGLVETLNLALDAAAHVDEDVEAAGFKNLEFLHGELSTLMDIRRQERLTGHIVSKLGTVGLDHLRKIVRELGVSPLEVER